MEKENNPDVLIIEKEIYPALHPIEQMMAQALQKVGKVKILFDDPRFNNL